MITAEFSTVIWLSKENHLIKGFLDDPGGISDLFDRLNDLDESL